MITDFVLDAIFGGIGALLGLAPSVTFPDTSGGTSGAWGIGIIHNMNNIVPISTAVSCLLALLALRVAMQAWDILVFVYHQFWGSGS